MIKRTSLGSGDNAKKELQTRKKNLSEDLSEHGNK
jgi:hypothetical protein